MTLERNSVKHPLAMRRISVRAISRPAPQIARVTFTGPELEGFVSSGPADHIKVFFPDASTGHLAAPTVTADGISRPETGVIISRYYTPLGFRANGNDFELDVDFVLHGDGGPASAWAARAAVGDEVVIGGPRGSKLVPEGVTRLILIADETALPSASLWIDMLPTSVPISAIFEVADESVKSYFSAAQHDRMSAEWLYGTGDAGQTEVALRALGQIDDTTFVFLAGESGMLIPLRRYLRRELGLPKSQVSIDGYWRRGVTDADHHAPLDPSDPEE